MEPYYLYFQIIKTIYILVHKLTPISTGPMFLSSTRSVYKTSPKCILAIVFTLIFQTAS